MRDERIDLLRSLGLAMIVLAHTQPPGAIEQARNFDVPLMVIAAGLAFRASNMDDRAYLSYLWGRAKRLVLPVWLFLSVYFAVVAALGQPTGVFGTEKVVSSYLLVDGIGYVWVIRVFLLVAVVSPFIYAYCRRESSHLRYSLAIGCVYVCYELALLAAEALPESPIAYVFGITIPYLVPYAVVFAIGVRLPELGRGQLAVVGAAALTVFLCWAGVHWVVAGRFVPTQGFKYPPQSYYLSYGVFVSVLAWATAGRAVDALRSARVLPAVLFVGQNSIWIYLWHIPFVEMARMPFYLGYPVVFLGATLITFLQVECVKRFVLPKVSGLALRRNLRALLTG